VFLWFVGIGGLTIAMAGGIARRPAPKPTVGRESASGPVERVVFDGGTAPEPAAEPKSADEPEQAAESEPKSADEPEQAAESEPGPPDEPEPQRESGPEREPEAELKPVFDAAIRMDTVRDPVDFQQDLPDPEDLEYVDDDATPGAIGDKSHPADD
jgi:hypothetical protein